MKSKEKRKRELIVVVLCCVLDYAGLFAAATGVRLMLTAEQITKNSKIINRGLPVAVSFVVGFTVMFVAFQLIFRCGYPLKKYLKNAIFCAVGIRMVYLACSLIAAIVINLILRNIALLTPACLVLDVLSKIICYFFAVTAVDTTPEEYELARQQQQAFLEEQARKKEEQAKKNEQ